ncbi:MAG TPA: aminoacyl-tRNA hydrolase [Thiothrix sp.]|nr:aminoacyl-tRNA hydrolase [Thiothrix sp.]
MSTKNPIRLIIGLGNPGEQYANTRHNAGFWLIEQLAEYGQVSLRKDIKFSGEVAKVQLVGQSVWLLKPHTFMNRSGLAAHQLANFYKIPPENILVVHDELDLPVGTVRLKAGGGHGGHNGLRDLHAQIGKNYWRLRLGIDHPGDKHQVSNYVLSKPSQADAQAIQQSISTCIAQIDRIVQGDMQAAMQVLHTQS